MKQVMPFFYYSKSFPALLKSVKATLLYSTYQAGKVIMISSQDSESITKYAKNFSRPMGLAISKNGNKLAVASKSEISIFSSNPTLARTFPDNQNTYSHLYIPQSKFHTGMVDTHEICWAGDDLLITNTLFSSISKMSHDYHFEEFWRPDFISSTAPEDRCHLNGMALVNDRPKYVTLFAQTDDPQGWRNFPYNSGKLIDIEENEVLASDLPLPHSPLVCENFIYFLASATGEVMSFDRNSGELKTLATFNSFVRGLDIVGDYLFLGMSKIRPDSQFFSKLPIKPEDSICGIRVINRHTGKEVAGLTYTERIEEIFAVRVGTGIEHPAILTEQDELFDKCLSIPENQNFWLKKK